MIWYSFLTYAMCEMYWASSRVTELIWTWTYNDVKAVVIRAAQLRCESSGYKSGTNDYLYATDGTDCNFWNKQDWLCIRSTNLTSTQQSPHRIQFRVCMFFTFDTTRPAYQFRTDTWHSHSSVVKGKDSHFQYLYFAVTAATSHTRLK